MRLYSLKLELNTCVWFQLFRVNDLQCLFSNHTGIHQCLFLHLIARVHINWNKNIFATQGAIRHFRGTSKTIRTLNLRTSPLHIKQQVGTETNRRKDSDHSVITSFLSHICKVFFLLRIPSKKLLSKLT